MINGSRCVLIVALFVVLACGKERKNDQLTLYAAASLNDVIGELTSIYTRQYKVEIHCNYASSGTLARQLTQGAIPDVYLSANKKWVDYTDSLGLIIDNKKHALIANELVLIAPLSSRLTPDSINAFSTLSSLLGNGLLAMGDPAHVPSGIYGKESLTYYDQFALLKNRIVPAKDARAALMYVELKEAALGIVYYTDAIRSQKVKILATFKPESHEPIIYYKTLCRSNSTANHFFEWLSSEEALPIWQKFGFK